MSRLFPKPMKDEGQPNDPEVARRIRGECRPWCHWSDNFPHLACESLHFTGIWPMKGRSKRGKGRRVSVTIAERHLHGLHSKKVLDESDPTWVHLETAYFTKREEKGFDVYLPPGEALRLAAALQAAATAAEGLDEPITQRVQKWRAWRSDVSRREHVRRLAS